MSNDNNLVEKSNNKSSIRHSSHHHNHRHHHRSRGYSKNHSKGISSIMERNGKNIIYHKVRKEKIFLTFKRSAFLIIFIALILFLIFSILRNPDQVNGFRFFKSGATEQENIELKNKIINYEYYIEELEKRLSKHEKVESIFDE